MDTNLATFVLLNQVCTFCTTQNFICIELKVIRILRINRHNTELESKVCEFNYCELEFNIEEDYP